MKITVTDSAVGIEQKLMTLNSEIRINKYADMTLKTL